MNKRNKGFTLIELLVVIAIIGILSAIVLASLNSARTKANEARVQSELASLRAVAEIYYSANNPGNYTSATEAVTTCNDTTSFLYESETIKAGGNKLIDDINKLTKGSADYDGMDCKVNSNSYAVAAKVSSAGAVWCVDSSGASKKSDQTDPALAISAAPFECN